MSPNVLIPLVGVTAATYTYLRYYKGYTMDDFYFASAKSLEAAAATLRDQIETVSELVNTVKKTLQEQLGEVENKLSSQMDANQEKLSQEINEKTGELSDQLANVDKRLSFGNKGIFLLCKVLLSAMITGTPKSNNQLTDASNSNNYLQLTNANSGQPKGTPRSQLSAFEQLQEFTRQHEYNTYGDKATTSDLPLSKASAPSLSSPQMKNESAVMRPKSKKKNINKSGKKKKSTKRRLSIESPVNWLGHIRGNATTITAAASSPALLISPKRD